MSKLVISGGQKLKGEITIEGAKNAVLPILAATVLNEGLSVIKNCPRLKDVEVMVNILKSLGCKVNMEDNIILIDSSTINNTFIPEELTVEMRCSIIFMGAILSKYGKVTISYPGDCVILWAKNLLTVCFEIVLQSVGIHSF